METIFISAPQTQRRGSTSKIFWMRRASREPLQVARHLQGREALRRKQKTQTDSNNASIGCKALVKLTHPCHPLRGAQGYFIRGPKTDSDDWILLELPDGKLHRIPKAWTSLAPVDAYLLLTSPPLLRLDCLFEVAEWVAMRRKKHTRRRRDSCAEKGGLL